MENWIEQLARLTRHIDGRKAWEEIGDMIATRKETHSFLCTFGFPCDWEGRCLRWRHICDELEQNGDIVFWVASHGQSSELFEAS